MNRFLSFVRQVQETARLGRASFGGTITFTVRLDRWTWRSPRPENSWRVVVDPEIPGIEPIAEEAAEAIEALPPLILRLRALLRR